MVALFLFSLVLAFAPAAVWALRAGGLRRLWLLCALSLAVAVLVALVLSASYAVPSPGAVVVYALTLCGPSFLFCAGSLSLAGAPAKAPKAPQIQLVTAFVGSMSGLVVGLLLVVYVLGVW